MYTLVSAVVRPRGETRHRTADLHTHRLVDLYAHYDVLYLYLHHTHVVDEDGQPVTLGLDLFKLQTQLRPNTATVDQWLQDNGGQSLPTDTPAKTLMTSTVHYQDARATPYRLDRVYRHAHPDSDYPLADRRNLLIHHDAMDHDLFHQQNLVTLGGLIHRSEHTAHGILVPDAVETLEKSEVDTVGLIDFSEVGEVSRRTFTADEVHGDGNGNPLKYRVALDFEEDIGDVAVGLVFLGRLYIGAPYLSKAHRHRVVFDTERLDWAGLYQHLRTRIDLSALGLEHPYGFDEVALMAEWTSDAVIRRMFELPQTFVITLPVSGLSEAQVPVQNSQVIGRCFTQQPTTLPLVGPWGYYQDYHGHQDWGQFVLDFPPVFERRYLHDTVHQDQQTLTTSHHETVHPRKLPHYHLQQLQVEELIN